MATVPGKSSTIKEQYQKFIGRKITFILILIPLLFILAGLAASLGSANVSIWDAYSAFLHRFLPNYFESSRLAEICVWKLRLPRILMGVAAGFGLDVAGCVMQGVLRNPLRVLIRLVLHQAQDLALLLAYLPVPASSVGNSW